MIKFQKESAGLSNPVRALYIRSRANCFLVEKGIHSFKTHFTMDTKVHCIHCGKEYLYREANVVQFPDNDEPLVYCKHYPECDGSLIDMMEV